jgi:phosphonate transport system substrate-binding protein
MTGKWFFAVLAVVMPFAAFSAEAELRIGVAPHTSARVILEMYQPLREKLQADLGVPVQIITAPDFTEFARRALAHEYDIAITTGHQARLLQSDGGFLPLVTYRAPFRSVLVVPRASKTLAPHDLDGTTVIGLSQTSLVTLWGEHWLAAAKAAPAQIRYVSAADSVAQLVLAGDAAAGMISLANFQGLPSEVQADLRFLVESAPMLGRTYMLGANWIGRRAEILKSLTAFAASPVGLRYFETYKLDGYRPVRQDELDSMEPYARDVRAELRPQAR